MACYVVDASVVIEYLITGPYTESARAFFRERTDVDEVYIPEFCLLECASVIWKRVRFNSLSRHDAAALLTGLRMLVMT